MCKLWVCLKTSMLTQTVSRVTKYMSVYLTGKREIWSRFCFSISGAAPDTDALFQTGGSVLNNLGYQHTVCVACHEEAPHRPGCQRDDDAGEKGEVVAWVSSMPHCWQQEGGSCRVVRTALVTHPAQEIQQASHKKKKTTLHMNRRPFKNIHVGIIT